MRKKFRNDRCHNRAPAMQDHPADSGVCERCVNATSRKDRAFMRADPCLDLSRCHVGRWIDYDSPMNDRLSTFNLRFTCTRRMKAHFRSAREFVRILMTLDHIGHPRAAAFLASAQRVHGLARRIGGLSWCGRRPMRLLSPRRSSAYLATESLRSASAAVFSWFRPLRLEDANP